MKMKDLQEKDLQNIVGGTGILTDAIIAATKILKKIGDLL